MQPTSGSHNLGVKIKARAHHSTSKNIHIWPYLHIIQKIMIKILVQNFCYFLPGPALKISLAATLTTTNFWWLTSFLRYCHFSRTIRSWWAVSIVCFSCCCWFSCNVEWGVSCKGRRLLATARFWFDGSGKGSTWRTCWSCCEDKTKEVS